MKKSRILNLVLLVGLLLTLSAMVGCAPVDEGTSRIMPLIITIALFFGLMYFLTIRPFRQREKRHDEMVQELEKPS